MRFISVRIIVPFRPAGAEPSAEYTENSRNRQLFREIPDLFFPRKTPILERPEKPGRPYGTERSPRIRRNGRKRLTHISHETMKRFVWMLLLLPIGLQAQVRTERLLEKGWRFTRDDAPAFAEPSYDDSRWQEVTVPHDWAIYGPFSAGNDLQHTAIAQDGQTQAVEHAGRTGGLPFVGTGWYRLRFEVPERNEGRRCTLLFDGAMSHARVYVNGREAIRWPNGYNSFHTDITPLLNPGGENLLAVRLENLPESSRWYPGAGIYRNVHLIVTDEAHVPVWGTQIITRRPTKRPPASGVHRPRRSAGKVARRLCDRNGGDGPRRTRRGTAQAVRRSRLRRPLLRAGVHDRPPRALVARHSGALHLDFGDLRRRRAEGPLRHRVRHPHGRSRAGRRIPAERQAAEIPGRLSPPRPRTAGRHRERVGDPAPDPAAEGDGLQRHTHLAQHAGSGADRNMRRNGHDGHGRIVRRVGDEEGRKRLPQGVRPMGRARSGEPRPPVPQQPERRDVVHRQRSARPMERRPGARNSPSGSRISATAKTPRAP